MVMQAGKKIDKWAERASVGIYLGRSSQHARTVALVLSKTTGLTSPLLNSMSSSIQRSRRYERALADNRLHQDIRMASQVRIQPREGGAGGTSQ
jgi:hypothetical protein